MVITLGNAALGAVRAVAVVDGHEFELRPMVHPGFLSKLGNRPEWQEALASSHPRLGTGGQQ